MTNVRRGAIGSAGASIAASRSPVGKDDGTGGVIVVVRALIEMFQQIGG